MSNLIQRLLGQLDNADIEAMRRGHDVKGLIKALEYRKDYLVRSRAAEALIELGDGEALQPLIAAVSQESNENCYQWMMSALSKSNDPCVVDACVSLLQYPGKFFFALTTLEKLHGRKLLDKRVVEPLITALDYRRPGSGNMIICSILGQLSDDRAVRPLIELLNASTNKFDCEYAIKALSEIGGNQAVEALIAALGGDNQGLLRHIIMGLGRIGGTRAVEPLIKSVIKETLHGSYSYNSFSDTLEVLDELDPTWKHSEVVTREIPALVSALWNLATRRHARTFLKAIDWQPNNDADKTLLAIADDDWVTVNKLGTAAVDVLIAELKRNLDLGILERRDDLACVAEALNKIAAPIAFMPLLNTLNKYRSAIYNKADWKDLETMTKLITVLNNVVEQSSSEIPEDALREAANMQDVYLWLHETTGKTVEDEDSYGHYTYKEMRKVKKTLDCSQLRQTSQREVERRRRTI